MRFTADRDALAAAVISAAQGVPAHPAQPVYAGLKITLLADQVQFTGSDGDVTFDSICDAENHDNRISSALLPGKLLAEVVRFLPAGPVNVSWDGSGRAEIAARRSVFTLSASSAGAYPGLSASPPAVGACDGEALRDAVAQVAPSAASGDMNPAMNCILLEVMDDGLHLVATNHSQMAHALVPLQLTLDAAPPAPAFLPPWVTQRFARAAQGEVSIGWDDRQVLLSAQGLSVTCRTVQGQFPGKRHWSQIILGDRDRWVTADPSELTRAVKMTQVAKGQFDTDTVTLEFTPGNLQVIFKGDKGDISENLDTDYSGEKVSFLMGAGVLLSGLSGCGDQMRLAFTAPPAPMLIESGGYRFICQPRREMTIGSAET